MNILDLLGEYNATGGCGESDTSNGESTDSRTTINCQDEVCLGIFTKYSISLNSSFVRCPIDFCPKVSIEINFGKDGNTFFSNHTTHGIKQIVDENLNQFMYPNPELLEYISKAGQEDTVADTGSLNSELSLRWQTAFVDVFQRFTSGQVECFYVIWKEKTVRFFDKTNVIISGDAPIDENLTAAFKLGAKPLNVSRVASWISYTIAQTSNSKKRKLSPSSLPMILSPQRFENSVVCPLRVKHRLSDNQPLSLIISADAPRVPIIQSASHLINHLSRLTSSFECRINLHSNVDSLLTFIPDNLDLRADVCRNMLCGGGIRVRDSIKVVCSAADNGLTRCFKISI